MGERTFTELEFVFKVSSEAQLTLNSNGNKAKHEENKQNKYVCV